jgi:site-specific recombinase XerD
VTHLRQIMLEELRRRNYAESTIHTYIQTVEHFSRHFHRPPDQLGPEHIRQYQAALFTRWKLAPNTVTQRLAALRFFYVQVLKRGRSVAETPYPKKVLHLPEVLSQEEVARLIDGAEFPFHRILLMTLYATGGRAPRCTLYTLKMNSDHLRRNAMSAMPFHEKAGRSQVGSFFFSLDKGFFSSRVATVATLPSALFVERFCFARCQLGVLVSAGAATC